MSDGADQTCPICGLLQPLEHEALVVWRTADWSAAQDRDQQLRHEHWLPICEDCSAEAMAFRVTYPLDLRDNERRQWRLVLTFGITLVLLVSVLFAGKSLVNSDPLGPKLLYALGWFLVGIGIIITGWHFSKTIAFELSGRKSWSGPWIEKRLIAALALPTGDKAPYWAQLDLLASLVARRRRDPEPPPPLWPDGEPVTITIRPG